MDERTELIQLIGKMTEAQWAAFQKEAVKVLADYLARTPEARASATA